jgi:hypothetical protein
MSQRNFSGKSGRSNRALPWVLGVGAAAALTALVLAVVPVLHDRSDASTRPPNVDCGRSLHVVTAKSYAPVLEAVKAGAASAVGCLNLDVEVADGRAAVPRAEQADVWIPDDTSWLGTAQVDKFAAKGTAGAETLLATSPIYQVTDRATANAIDQAGGSWLALAHLLAAGTGPRLVVRDPATSADGLVGAGAIGESVWLDKGMDASALNLSKALRVTRTVPGDAVALPAAPGEVGLVPEYALLPRLAQLDANLVVLSGRDHTALLRYTWLPTAEAARDPQRNAALNRLLAALTGPAAPATLRTAALRQPEGGPPNSPNAGRLPQATAKPFDVLAPHHVDHVFSTWYPVDRAMNLLIVTDVSGSMSRPAPQSTIASIELVRQGCKVVTQLLPDTARLGLWEFGVDLDPPRDYHVLVPTSTLDHGQRDALDRAIDGLAAKPTGTGLYDTIVAAYRSVRDGYQSGVPNQVVVFTDGLNEDDPNSISASELTGQLAALNDPARPVQLTLLTFGQSTGADTLTAALKPVNGTIQALNSADDIQAVFIHITAGGLHAG